MAKPKKQSKPVEQTPESTDRLSSLKQLAKQMSSHFNNQYKQAISYVPDSSMIASVTVSRWVEMPEAFQEAVELPGLPFGNITCIYGKPDTGKTTILMEGIKACQDQGILPILILTEHKFDFTRLPTFMGADPDAMLVLPAESLEQGYEFVEKILRDVKTGVITVEDEEGKELSIDISKHGCYIFWDSIGNTMSETELEYEVADHGKSMGKAAKAIKTLTRRVNQLLGKVRQQVGILFLNQSYQSMPSYGPSVETPYGGDGIPYSSALVLRTRRIRDIKMTTSGKESVVGLEMKLQVMKNHISHSKPTAEVFVLASGLATPSEQTLKEYKAFLKKLD